MASELRKRIFGALETLNDATKGEGDQLLEEKVDLKAAKKKEEADLKELFLTAVESIPTADDDYIPGEIAALYEEIAHSVDGGVEESMDKGKGEPETTEQVDKREVKVAAKKGKEKKVDKKKTEPAKEEKTMKKEASKAPAKVEQKKQGKAQKTGKPTKGVGAFVVSLLKTTKLSNEEIATKARDKFSSNTSPASVAWYKNKLSKK